MLLLILERERERERNINIERLPPARPLLGMEPMARACALTGNRRELLASRCQGQHSAMEPPWQPVLLSSIRA